MKRTRVVHPSSRDERRSTCDALLFGKLAGASREEIVRLPQKVSVFLVDGTGGSDTEAKRAAMKI
jgi:hypothetical protein